MNTPAPKLLDLVRLALRRRHSRVRTERAYCDRIRRFILYNGTRHPGAMGSAEVRALLDHLARDRNVSASTQNQALAALLFLYNDVLAITLERQSPLIRAQRRERIPIVLTPADVSSLLAQLDGTPYLMASLLYGAGLRLLECAKLRIKDIDLERREIRVRDGKGRKDRLAPLPIALIAKLELHLHRARQQHQADLRGGPGYVEIPDALRSNTRTLLASGPGNGSSLPPAATSAPNQANAAVTTSTKPSSNAPSDKPPWLPSAATPCATPSPPTCWRPDATSAPSKSSSATAMSRPP
jgi:integrase